MYPQDVERMIREMEERKETFPSEFMDQAHYYNLEAHFSSNENILSYYIPIHTMLQISCDIEPYIMRTNAGVMD
jgi:hypothetical protein